MSLITPKLLPSRAFFLILRGVSKKEKRDFRFLKVIAECRFEQSIFLAAVVVDAPLDRSGKKNSTSSFSPPPPPQKN